MQLGSLNWGSWIYGLIGAFVGGGSGAVTSGLVVSFKDPKDYAMGSWNFFQLVGAVFLVQGTVAFFAMLHTKPLPDVITKVTTTETSVLPTHPPVTITKKVEEITTAPAEVKPKDAEKP